ncbi:biotin/lipoyl-binding carrier protein [Angustibacter aerolatus]
MTARAPGTPGPVSEVASELVANVLTIEVEVGQQVAEGDTLVLLESMKMEIPVLAPHDGTVTDVRTAPGDVVQDGDVMVVVQG